MSVFAPSAALLHSVPPPLRLAALSAHPAYAPGAALSPYGASLTLPAPGFLLTVPEPVPVAPLVLPEPSAAAADSAAPSARAGGGKYVGGFKGLPNFAASQAAPTPSGGGGGAAGKFGRGRGPSGGEAGALAASPAGGSAPSLARGGGGGGGGGGAAAAANALPEGWTTQRDDEGDTYYFNSVTGESRWERPLPPKGAARTWGGAAGASSLSSSGQVFQGIKAAGPAVKSTLVTSPVSAPKVEIEAVTVDGDVGCDAFEANPFKPEMCKRCRKLRTKH